MLAAAASQGMELSLSARLAAQMYSLAVAIALSTVDAIDHHSLKGKVVFVFALVNIVLKDRICL